jgi:hypothetical protein
MSDQYDGPAMGRRSSGFRLRTKGNAWQRPDVPWWRQYAPRPDSRDQLAFWWRLMGRTR